jgi:AbrB family looped-hinge helix DNA binding protein
MQAIAAQISTKYQIVIPKPVREALGIRPQDSLLFVIDGDTVIVRPRPASLTTALRGLHADLWPDPDGWLEEERASWV